MKTHRIILPVPQHEAALRGVDRLLLPMDRAAKARLREAGGPVIEANNYCTGAPERGLAWYWKDRGCWNSTDPFFPPYKRGDRLALLESFRTGQCMPWKPASRMPLRACRCFYRVLAVEPACISDISEEHARECGFEDERVNEFPPVRSAKSPLYEAWLALGRSGADWAWSAQVDRWKDA